MNLIYQDCPRNSTVYKEIFIWRAWNSCDETEVNFAKECKNGNSAEALRVERHRIWRSSDKYSVYEKFGARYETNCRN